MVCQLQWNLVFYNWSPKMSYFSFWLNKVCRLSFKYSVMTAILQLSRWDKTKFMHEIIPGTEKIRGTFLPKSDQGIKSDTLCYSANWELLKISQQYYGKIVIKRHYAAVCFFKFPMTEFFHLFTFPACSLYQLSVQKFKSVRHGQWKGRGEVAVQFNLLTNFTSLLHIRKWIKFNILLRTFCPY